MSRKGDYCDNAVVERFLGSPKQERVQWNNYQTYYEAQQNTWPYIITVDGFIHPWTI